MLYLCELICLSTLAQYMPQLRCALCTKHDYQDIPFIVYVISDSLCKLAPTLKQIASALCLMHLAFSVFGVFVYKPTATNGSSKDMFVALNKTAAKYQSTIPFYISTCMVKMFWKSFNFDKWIKKYSITTLGSTDCHAHPSMVFNLRR